MRELDGAGNRKFYEELMEVVEASNVPDHDVAAILAVVSHSMFMRADDHRECETWDELVATIIKEYDPEAPSAAVLGQRILEPFKQ